MPKGVKLLSPTDPEENRIYHERRKKNNESAKKHRGKAKDQIAEGQMFKKMYEKHMQQQSAREIKLQQALDASQSEIARLRRLLNIDNCCCNAVPGVAYQAAPAPAPVYTPHVSNPVAGTVQPDTRRFQSSSSSLDSYESESYGPQGSISSQNEFPADVSGWVDSTAHYTVLSNSVASATTIGNYRYPQNSSYHDNSHTTLYPSGMVNNGCPPTAPVPVVTSSICSNFPAPSVLSVQSMANSTPIMAKTTQYHEEPEITNLTAACAERSTQPQLQTGCNEKNGQSGDFWTTTFPARKKALIDTPAEANYSPLSETFLKGQIKSKMPELPVDFVHKVLSPGMEKVSLRN